ncbi:MAG: DNA double-strand break repair nuclease NurA, partial [Nitrosarchaeum sp.]
MESSQNNEFADLPQALVEEMLNSSNQFAKQTAKILTKINTAKENLHDILEQKKMINHESTILKGNQAPTTVGIDGSYCVDRLLASNYVAMGAVAVEGLTPPKLEEPIWPRPRHFVKILPLPHDDSSIVWAQAIMFSMEIQLAGLSPHDVVLLDGSISTHIISFNKALNYDSPKELVSYFMDGDKSANEGQEAKFGPLKKTLESYKQIISAERTDKIAVCLPKYSKRNEICEEAGLKDYDDKGMLTLVLKPGEFTKPINVVIGKETGKHLHSKIHDLEPKLANDIEELMDKTCVFYYKPYAHFPALRIEMGRTIAENKSRLAILLEAIKRQSGAPGMFEPFPIFMADKMVKHLSTALPAIKRQSVME